MKKRIFQIVLFLTVVFSIFLVEAEDPIGVTLLERGSDYNLYYNETNGSNFYRVYPTHANFYNGTGYEPIDTGVVDSGCEYDYCVRKGIYHADFKDNSKEQRVYTEESL